MNKFKVGVVGCGLVSDDHIKGWLNIEDVELTSVCDIRKEKALKKCKEYGINSVYSDYKEMIKKEKFDILDVLTPVKFHKEIVINVAEKGINILCEKPFADNMADAIAMVRSCEKNGIKIMVSQTNRWFPWFRRIKKELDMGTIGVPYYSIIAQRVSYSIPQGPKKIVKLIQDQPIYKEADKLVLLEQGCHYIDIFRFFFGEAIDVYADVRNISSFVIGDDIAIVLVRFPSLTAVLEESWVSNSMDISAETIIEGTEGSIYFEGTTGPPHRSLNLGSLEIKNRKGKSKIIPQKEKNYYHKSFELVQRHFVDCLKNDKEPITSGKDNLRSLDIVFKAYESSNQNKVIIL